MRCLGWVLLAAPLFARSYSVDGIVVAVDPAARTMLVSHRPIAHYMPAMTMPFRVAASSDLAPLHPGSRVQFDLTVGRERSVASNVRVTGQSEIRPASPGIAIGQALPGFHLTGQDGRGVSLADLRGKVVAIDFIYTRCPLPDVCPRLSANFAVLARRFAGRVLLLSVTVDPDYDTPSVLAAYARRWNADPGTWRFLTGDVAGLAAALGEVYWFDEGSIGHNSMTSIFSRDGRLAAVVEGAAYRPDQLADLIARQLEDHP
ncbi:MAG TPA: SCO family protein [Candidatus Acidoferrales bacterium]|nr:SCO family protein [Candidatus Acidoferrales bacterium]